MTQQDFAAEMREWRELIKELRERHEAMLRIELFENGVLVPERLDEYDRAKAALDDANRRRDALRETLQRKRNK